jgi:mannose-1-phosphate guanylyltransferase
MKALLLAAGLGTRLRPITDNIPKCLVKINGKPLLEIWLDSLYKSGIKSFIINTHYLAEQVENFILNSKYRKLITISYEKILLGTAGTIKANKHLIIDDELLLIHADNYCLTNFELFFNSHLNRPKNCELTMMSFRTNDPKSCGIIEVNNDNIVTNFYEKEESCHGNLANGAVYILSKKLIYKIINNNYSDFSTEVIPSLLGNIYNFENCNIHIDIGNLKSYLFAQSLENNKLDI